MEILLLACLMAYAAGAQSEQVKLGVSPAQRAVMRENVRHEKAVRRIAERHGGTPDLGNTAETSGTAVKAAPGAGAPVLTLPEAFRSGYRQHPLVDRLATPLGRRAGGWAAQGVGWARDTGRGAVREYRKRRQAAGHDDPAPVLVPLPPSHPPTIGVPAPAGVPLAKPARPAPAAPATRVAENVAPLAPSAAPDTTPPAHPATPKKGVGRMAAEVTYDSVMEESDELSLMCEDDQSVYERLRERCEREIGRADTLISELKSPGIQAWIARCAEQYRVILAQLDDLKANTLAQGEAVIKAKASLEAGQGFYANIAADMETVEEREFYTSDAVDSEDTNADTEVLETRGAAA